MKTEQPRRFQSSVVTEPYFAATASMPSSMKTCSEFGRCNQRNTYSTVQYDHRPSTDLSFRLCNLLHSIILSSSRDSTYIPVKNSECTSLSSTRLDTSRIRPSPHKIPSLYNSVGVPVLLFNSFYQLSQRTSILNNNTKLHRVAARPITPGRATGLRKTGMR
jgi:hypothetical protein